jgi:hypothetical protein
MNVKMLRDRWARPFLYIFLLAGLSLACNAPLINSDATPTRERPRKEAADTPVPERPAVTSEPDATLGSPATVPVIIGTPAATGPPGSPPDTPTVVFPTLAPTVTPSNTPTRRPASTSTPDQTTTPSSTHVPGNDGPLSFTFEIVWSPHPTNPLESIATVTVYPSGGGGGYEYYMGGIPVDGPTWQYAWRNCNGNPQSLTVTSADGQRVTENYYENPPCPTPSPTP